MKKVFILLSFIVCFLSSFGQNILPRSNASVTAADARLEALLNLYIPRYIDTLDANAHIGIDSCGAIIFTYSGNSFWQRQCNPKKWAFVGGINIFNSTSTINIIDTTVLNQTTISICTGNGACDTFIVNTTVRNLSTAFFVNDSTIILCDTIQNCNTVHIPQQQLYVFQNGLNSPSPGIAEWGGTLFRNPTIINQNGVDLKFLQTQTGGFDIIQTHNGSNAGLQLTNPGSIGLGFSGNGDINSSNTNISLRGFGGLTNIISQFYGGITFPLFPNTVAPIGISSKFLSTDGNGNVGFYSVTSPEQCGPQFGDIVTFDSTHNGQGYYDVSNGSYCINPNDYSNPITLVIIPQGDSTFTRIDDFIGDTFSVVSSQQGTPAANPVSPQVDPNSQIEFTTVTINPLDSLPAGLIIQNIYDQNLGTAGGEFNPSAFGLAVNYANTVNPVHLTIAADVGAITNGDRLNFVNNTQLTLSNYFALKFYIRLKSAWATNVRMSLQWTLGNAVISTNNVNIGGNASLYGFSRTTVGAYQVITIPTTAWSRTTDVFDGLRIVFTGANAQGIYLDWIQLQGGIAQSTGGNPGVQSIAMTGNILVTPVVTNPTGPNVSIGLNLTPACAGCFPGNQTSGTAVPTYAPINLSNNGNFSGTLPPVLITPGVEGSILQVVSGVPQFTTLPLGYDTTFVLPPLFVLPGTTNDTLGLHLFAGTNITIDSTSDGMTINATGGGGGGSGINIYNSDSTLSSNRTVDQNGKYLAFINGKVGIGATPSDLFDVNDGSNNLLSIDASNLRSKLQANDGSGDNFSVLNLYAGSSFDGPSFLINIGSTAGGSATQIYAVANTGAIGYTAVTHTFNGVINYNTPPSGTTNDSLMLWNSSTQALEMINAANFATTLNQFQVGIGNASNQLSGANNLIYDGDFLTIDGTASGTHEASIILNAANTHSNNVVFNMAGATYAQLGTAGTSSSLWNAGDLLAIAYSRKMVFSTDGSAHTAMEIGIDSSIRFNAYGKGNYLGTPIYSAGWDANGKFVESSPSAGIKAKADSVAKTTALANITSFTPSTNGTFRIGGYINITAVTAGIVTLKVTYTDENSQSVTQIIPLTIASTGAVGTTATVLNSNNSATDILIRAKGGSTITVLTTLTNVATYDVGARIEQL